MTDGANEADSDKTNVSLTIASVASKQRIFKLTCLTHEITGVKVVQKKGKQTVFLKLARKGEKTWHKLFDDASTKEAVADDTANSNTSNTSRVSQTTLSDFSKNLEEPSPTENEEEIDDQTRSMESHEIQCEKEYRSDLRADTGTLTVPSWQDRDGKTQFDILRVNLGARRQRAPDSKSRLAIRPMTKFQRSCRRCRL